ncbi:hypothetical protein RXV86_10410 [Alisedimentitalea sp. MJ-SS2]|uniref:hypothetical protein n=1 Tax=Aliisedimentitalea sp. MJ-SS2 TaxID=3049795 RepID=UPI00290F5830|nr:hypothetical protein [Alisedimentitalea sp. MJ-SS2]MDU8927795.1 hypothetical protein [Alisedimentitalea sp. MJ-SS2]
MSTPASTAQAAQDGLQTLKSLLDTGDIEQLAAQAEEMSRTYPDKPGPMRFLALALSRQQNHDEAKHALATARERGLPDASWLGTRMTLALNAKDWPEVTTTAELLAGQEGTEGASVLARLKDHYREPYCEALVETGQADTASRLIDGFTETADDMPWIARAKFRCVTALHDMDGVADACEAWVTRPGANPGDAMVLRLMGLQVPELERRAREIVTRLYHVDPTNPVVQRGLQALQLQPDGKGNLVRAARIARRDIKLASSNAEKLRIAFQAFAEGKSWDTERYTERLAEEFSDRDFRRPLIEDNPEKDVNQSEIGDNSRTALVFGTMGLPLTVLDAYFAVEGTTAIYVWDFRKTMALSGVQSLGSDFEETVQALRKLVSGIGGTHLTTYGTSGMALPALRYGVALNAQNVIGISAATTATEDFVRRASDTRGKLLTRRLYAMFDQSELCGKTALLTSSARPRVDLVFGAEAKVDIPHAEEVRNVENVHLHALPDCAQHPVTRELVLRGMLADTLAGRIEGHPGLIAG